ncbi:MAG TPA: alcohol dehydrogenase catalytic domain-containing protein [Gemmatimonadaceae bacterium]|nr:alcohol dehydrogenase catalytic domain-containing protein [Gemmatimonadaceae bacterium]
MKAITFAAPIPRYLATLAGGTLSDRFYLGSLACTRYGDVEDPALPSERWVRIRTRLGGICGSDLNVITLKASPSTSPFSSFPFVIGHENVGEVVEVGRAVHGVSVGVRVTVNPLLCCEPREIAPACEACAAGDHSRCAHFTDGALPPGMLLGTTRGLGGSWGERFVAHESQVVAVPESMTDEEAVLVEPFACSVHAVRSNLPADGARVLVIGGGSIGLLTVAALRALAPQVRVTLLARHAFQRDRAKRLGAERGIDAHGSYLPELAEAGGTRLLKPIIGKPVGVGGFDQTFVCVGGAAAMDDAMRVTRAGGTVVLLGNSSAMNGIDWTPLWLKELTVRGSLCYGAHAHASPARSAFDEAAALIASGRAPIGDFVTHIFPLARYRQAIDVARSKRAEHSIKVAFRLAQ